MAEMWTVIIKNGGGAVYSIEDLGIEVPALSNIDFSDQYTFNEIAGSDNLREAVSNGNLVVNNGTIDLDSTRGVDHLTLGHLDKENAAIGDAEDGSYTDGLFTDFEPHTKIGVPIDRFNELFGSLCPAPAPDLSSMSMLDNGVDGKLSFGSSNAISGYTNVPAQDINTDYNSSGNRKGIFNATTTINGELADNVTPNYTNNRPHPNHAFGAGDKGSLHLVVNGVTVHTVDLTTFGSGNSLNGNGSGFNLSAATSVEFDSGDSLDLFKYRTGTWIVPPTDQQNGYNIIQVRHEHETGSFRDTQVYNFVDDHSITATSYASPLLDNLVMAGSKYLSGVDYYQSGHGDLDITINNPYRNTYKGGNAITFQGTRCSASSKALTNMTTEADTELLTNETVNVLASLTRILNQNIQIQVSALRTVQGTIQSSAQTLGNLLLDTVSDNGTVTNEPMNGEGRRINANVTASQATMDNINYGTGGVGAQPDDWDSTVSLMHATDTDHNTGLLEHYSQLTYPKITNSPVVAGNFSSMTYGPAGNPNYSTAANNRTYYRFFYNSQARSNFMFNITCSGTSFVSVATGPSGNNLTFELLAPATTSIGGTTEFKDGVVAFTNENAIGCYSSAYGNSIPTNWGMSLGSKNTSTSGFVVVIRITASASWTGNISNIAITWL